LIGALAACDNPVKPSHHDDPATVIVLNGTIELARADVQGFTGEIIVAPGTQSPLLTVVFLDEEGLVIEPDGEHVLRGTVEDADVATWVPVSVGAFTGRVQGGAQAGQSMLTLEWIHGSVNAGHVEAEFSVRVTVSP